MLVLSRQENERVRIGDNIIVTVIQIRGDKARLGFEAPNDVPIHREEVYDAIKREAAAAQAADPVSDDVTLDADGGASQ